jgi:hypothetical protein
MKKPTRNLLKSSLIPVLGLGVVLGTTASPYTIAEETSAKDPMCQA